MSTKNRGDLQRKDSPGTGHGSSAAPTESVMTGLLLRLQNTLGQSQPFNDSPPNVRNPPLQRRSVQYAFDLTVDHIAR